MRLKIMNLYVEPPIMKTPRGPVRMPGKAKPKAKGTSRASKPRKSATKSKSPRTQGSGNPLPGSSTSGSATWGIGAGRPWPACGR